MVKKRTQACDEEINILQLNKIRISEAEEARQYVLTKEMQRPKTNAFTIAVLIILYFAVGFAVPFVISRVVDVRQFKPLLYVGSYLLLLMLTARFFMIKAVECYQHYAKESTRRKCLCKPTCSEYAIAVLKKYCLIKALHRIRIRLFKTCKDYYKLDPP